MIKKYLRQIRWNRSTGSNYRQLKYYGRWMKSFSPGSSSIADEQPWLTFEAMDFISGHIHSSSKVFEYGGGGSTLFFTKLAGETITVEHDAEWFNVLSNKMKANPDRNWKGKFIPMEKGDLFVPPDPADPSHYSSTHKNSVGVNYRNYASSIDTYPDGYFDLVLVDGRSRASCIAHALPKIKRGGYLVLDNSNRDYYLRAFQTILQTEYKCMVKNTGPCPYVKDFTQTSVWRKIK
ncbi:MAG TPA: hypothetical protein PLU53_12830 [Bacteroidia bacterium]|nr:hypothetical protein [Bacteroidia bacterium]